MTNFVSRYTRLRDDKEKMSHIWFASLILLACIAFLMIASAQMDERLKIAYLALYLLIDLRAAYVYWRTRDAFGAVTKLENYMIFSILVTISLMVAIIAGAIHK